VLKIPHLNLALSKEVGIRVFLIRELTTQNDTNTIVRKKLRCPKLS